MERNVHMISIFSQYRHCKYDITIITVQFIRFMVTMIIICSVHSAKLLILDFKGDTRWWPTYGMLTKSWPPSRITQNGILRNPIIAGIISANAVVTSTINYNPLSVHYYIKAGASVF